jgi:hypothetical protein
MGEMMDLESAQKICSTIEVAFQEIHEYRNATLSEFPRLDHDFYRAVSEQFVGLGFIHLGDLEDLTLSRQNKSFATCIRTFAGDDGAIQGSLFHVKLGGFLRILQIIRVIPNNLKSIDLESEFNNGHFIVTSNSKSGFELSSPPQIDTEYSPGTPLNILLEHHRQRVGDYMSQNKLVAPVVVKTLKDSNQSQARMNVLKSVYRKSIGILSAEELETFGVFTENESLIDVINSRVAKEWRGPTNR